MRISDWSSDVCSSDLHMKGLAPAIAPLVDVFHPLGKGRDIICATMGCCPADLPDGEGWGAERLHDMSTHCGTHVDAPLHSGATIEGKPARTITDIGLERSEEHTSELQSLMRISYAVFC